MRSIVLYIVSCLLLIAATVGPSVSAQEAGDAAERYVAGYDDLPLMPGLTENDEADVIFDNPDGRIIETYATGKISVEAARAFYKAALPQLGWSVLGPDSFRREGEVLRLQFQGGGRQLLTVHFSIAPG